MPWIPCSEVKKRCAPQIFAIGQDNIWWALTEDEGCGRGQHNRTPDRGRELLLLIDPNIALCERPVQSSLASGAPLTKNEPERRAKRHTHRWTASHCPFSEGSMLEGPSQPRIEDKEQRILFFKGFSVHTRCSSDLASRRSSRRGSRQPENGTPMRRLPAPYSKGNSWSVHNA